VVVKKFLAAGGFPEKDQKVGDQYGRLGPAPGFLTKTHARATSARRKDSAVDAEMNFTILTLPYSGDRFKRTGRNKEKRPKTDMA